MFHSATIRLTIIYVAFLALISIFFSLAWYRVATTEVERGLGRQRALLDSAIRARGMIALDDVAETRTAQLRQSSNQTILARIATVNIVLLTVGGISAYFLAKRTLRPIATAHESQARFTADASHELRTPLTALRTEIEVALRSPRLDSSQTRKLLKSNLEEITKLSRLTDNLLRLSRGDTGQQLELKPTSLITIVSSATERCKKIAQTKHITITNAVSDELVHVDSEAIEEIIYILLDNAIKYSPDKSSVHISTDVTDKKVTLHIRDQGSGIRASDLPHIFERFYRADQSRSNLQTSGYGLGLAIAQQIASAHGTNILVTSTIGKGSDFYFTLRREPKK